MVSLSHYSLNMTVISQQDTKLSFFTKHLFCLFWVWRLDLFDHVRVVCAYGGLGARQVGGVFHLGYSPHLMLYNCNLLKRVRG